MSVLGPVPSAAAVPGELRLLSCPVPLCSHAEFTLARVLATRVSLTWSPQPAMPGTQQATLMYVAPSGTAGLLASALRDLKAVRFEVVEAAAPGVDAERYSYDAQLGLHRASLSANGDVVVGEGALRSLLEACAGAPPQALAHGLERLIGAAWDEALDPLRVAGEGIPPTPLRSTG